MSLTFSGDIQPFTQLGQRLQKDGHRVRLATHATFRDFVIKSNLEFYPLGGDPQKLSEYMVRTHGSIIPSLGDLINEVPKNMAMLSEIIHSCWGACVSKDPGDPQARYIHAMYMRFTYNIHACSIFILGFYLTYCNLYKNIRPFIADSIISNPVTYGHIHCAEALGIPLHLMFPQVSYIKYIHISRFDILKLIFI